MSEYTDFWKSLDLPVDQSPKTRAFNTVVSNSDKLNLSPDEQYSLGWGQDAVPEDWVKARAKEITDQINGAESTAILKRGLDKAPKTQEELNAEAAAKALEDAKAAVNTPGAPVVHEGGSGDGPSGSPASNEGHEASGAFPNMVGDYAIGYSAKDAAKGFLGLGLPGLAYGITATKDPMMAFMKDQLAAQEDRDIAAAHNGTGGNFSQADLNSFNATNDPIGALADSIGMGDTNTSANNNGNANDTSDNGKGDNSVSGNDRD